MSAGDPNKAPKGCLLYELPFPDRARLSDLFSKMMPDCLLAIDQGGIERNAHVTVGYGFSPEIEVEDELAALLAETKPISLAFGELGEFEAPTHICLHAQVISPEMVDLHYRIRSYFGDKFKCTYPNFHPHATVAYLKRSPEAEQFVGDTRLSGETFLARELVYSVDRGGKRCRRTFVLGQPVLSESVSRFLAAGTKMQFV